MSETIGFIGLGHLGLPLATNLHHAGYALRVYNRTASKAEALVTQGAQQASRPVDAVTTGGIVVTLVWDGAASRRLLAVYLTFDPPSYRSVMMVLRVCVRRLGRLPQMLVVDGGKEFRSRYFEALVNTSSCHKKYRPWAKPRYGAVIERLFGTTNTKFVFNLQGNTQASKTARQMTKAVNPKNQALWLLPDLYSFLCEWARRGSMIRKSTRHWGKALVRHGRVDWILEGYENTDAFAMMTCFGC